MAVFVCGGTQKRTFLPTAGTHTVMDSIWADPSVGDFTAPNSLHMRPISSYLTASKTAFFFHKCSVISLCGVRGHITKAAENQYADLSTLKQNKLGSSYLEL